MIKLQFTSSRLGSIFDNVNTVGFYFAIAFTISLFLGLIRNKRIEVLYLIPSALFMFCGLFTGSRAFLIVLMFGIISVLYVRFRKYKIIFLAVVFSLFILVYFLIQLPSFAFIKDQFDRTLFTLFGVGNSKVDTSTMERVIWPRYGFYLGLKNLFIGYGVRGFELVTQIGTYSHNNYSEIICNFGIIGFFSYYFPFILLIVLSLKSKDQNIKIVFPLAIIYLVRNMFGVTYYSKDTWLVLALCFYFTCDTGFLSTLFRKNNGVRNCLEINI